MKYKIVADSSSNILSWSSLEYSSVPLKIISPEKEYIDDKDLNIARMSEELKVINSSVTTSCPNPQDWIDSFGDADCIFAITITSHLSGCYNSACIAAEQYSSLYPDKQVFVIDSLSIGGSMELIIEKLTELINNNTDFDQIKEQIIKYRDSLNLQFCLRSLTNLANNGRVSKTLAKISGVLGIRLIGMALTGNLHPTDKSRGEKKAISTMFQNMINHGYKGGKVRISHAFNPSGADLLKEQILQKYPTADILINQCTALCTFYAEEGGIIIGYECA